ncbi:cytochrome c biogenesis protein CcdA [Pseudactinotalea sp. HY160]|uniref:cytochrome c biogenesis CcdA family protein n=1 Tax=Pseudactinotalea sp. HY160 TaxID=2654490 RepID=UPI00128B5A1C|nr:cytochrome c biogenesis CcdA family protein [Pseudactinotalea sp. HY160]MPV50866.1 cytochrome c biogenesis protein CcdA [Pseudactinotalea sp. HY160]
MEISLLAAVLGGALALLSPCGALLLPAFFASSAGTGTRLGAHVGLFYAGLLVVLVPLGLGASALGLLFTQHRSVLIVVAGVLIIAFGVMQIAGWGFRLDRLAPTRAAAAARGAAGVARAFFLGITSGVAGFCAGPILGAVLTLAAAQGDPVGGAILLAAYGAGMVLPLVILVIVWHRVGIRNRARGRTFTVAGRAFHTTSVLTGLLLIAVGTAFITTNGLVSVPQLVDLKTQSSLQQGAAGLGTSLPEIALIVVAALVALGLWWWWPRERTDDAAPPSSESASPAPGSRRNPSDSRAGARAAARADGTDPEGRR